MKQQNENSLAAWAKVKESISETKRRILVIIGRRGNATMYEVAEEMGVAVQVISGRFSQMMKDGLIEYATNDGKKVRRKNRNGNNCGAYQIRIRQAPQLQLFEGMDA